MIIQAYAPATSANLNVGFDALGLALKPISRARLGDVVEAAPHEGAGEQLILELKGVGAAALPSDPELNLVTLSWRRFCAALEARGLKPLPSQLTLHKGLPIGSGLGSSACSVVASLVALNALHDEPLGEAELLSLMGKLEGEVSGAEHYDNVAPSLLGGLQLVLNEGERVSCPLPQPEGWLWVLCYPGVSLSTAAARGALPTHYEREVALRYGQRLAGFVSACYRQDLRLAARLMQDVIAEPHRAPLIKGLSALRAYQSPRSGETLIASGISGAGPTLFAVVDELEEAEALRSWMERELIQAEGGFALICEPDLEGARLIQDHELSRAVSLGRWEVSL